ncbi:hypothetical protein DYB32_002029, partial [Aphanomyces invadans]
GWRHRTSALHRQGELRHPSSCRTRHAVAIKLDDGTLFDSSRERGRTFEFKVGAGQVIRGWDEGIKKMSKGQIARLELPPSFGYGEHGYPPIIPPHATLYYEIELLTFCS